MLYTDLIEPAQLTEYARLSMAEYERRRGTLAQFLPNRTIGDIIARFVKGSTGLVDVARFRAYDAEIEVGARPAGQRVTLELPALGMNLPVSEYEQLRARGGSVSDQQALATVLSTTDAVVQAVSDGIERLRGIVLSTGKATIDQGNFAMDDDFGRPAGHTVTAPALWSVSGTDAISQLEGWSDTYRDATGEDPGAMLMSRRVFRALATLDQFQTTLIGGAQRPATAQQVNDIIETAGLPPIVQYDRRVKVNGTTTKALPDDVVLLLPSPVATDDFMGTDLGATIWGRTLTATEPGWNLQGEDQAGVIAGVWRHEKPPMGLEVIGDAIGLPVLANADRSFAATVL